MDAHHVNTYLNFIEALLQCAKGEEWLLLQQHEHLIDAELLTVMEQVSNQLSAEGNTAAAKFLHYWAVQLALLQQQNTPETSEESRSKSYLQLIQTLLSCHKGDELAILSQHPELMDAGLVYMMNQAAAQLAAKGNQDIAIYLRHLATEVNRLWLHPTQEPANIPTSTTPTNIPTSTAPANIPTSTTPTNIPTSTAPANIPTSTAPTNIPTSTIPTNIPTSTAPANNHSNELLEQISKRLENLEALLIKQSATPNPLWYMPILEEVSTHAWVISSEEVEKLIGIKPYCTPGHNSFVRGCWEFVKTGKIGIQSSWRVVKETTTLATELTPAPEGNSLQPELTSPWSENS